MEATYATQFVGEKGLIEKNCRFSQIFNKPTTLMIWETQQLWF